MRGEPTRNGVHIVFHRGTGYRPRVCRNRSIPRMTSPPRRLRAIATALGLCLSLATPAAADEVAVPAGAYVAARQALMQNDFPAAARYLGQALAQDPENPALLENAIVARVAMGAGAEALPLAERLEALGGGNQIVALVIMAEAAAAGQFDAILARYDAGGAVSPLIDGLLRAWALAGAGRMSDALDAFTTVSKDAPLRALAGYHKALALALAGDLEAAADSFVALGPDADGLGRSALRAEVQTLSQLERPAAAITRIEAVLDGSSDPEFDRLRARIEAGEVLPFDEITGAGEGMGLVLFALAGALQGEVPDANVLLYTRLAQRLDPGNVDILLQVADLLGRLGQHELSAAAFEQVPPEHPLSYNAELGRADALFALDKPDAAIEVLKALARKHPDILGVQIALGDALRRLERYAEAAPVYDTAIALIDRVTPRHWSLFYTRGIARERTGDWDGAEADFRRALDLSPDQPLVLNYLGYSLVERREKLDEAQDMIETAVAARPDDGYITDSLGWVLYRLGKYAEAVAPMERAVELEPTDAVINDHLGDVYWMVGRQREARFQWQRALSFAPEPEEAARIRRKIEFGLDAVLAEEEAKTQSRNAN